MRIKDLIKLLKREDPEEMIAVPDFNGVCRKIICIHRESIATVLISTGKEVEW